MLQKPALAVLTLLCFSLVYIIPREALSAVPSVEFPARAMAVPTRAADPAEKIRAELRRLERRLDLLSAPGASSAGPLSQEERRTLLDTRALVRSEGGQVLRRLAELTGRLEQISASATARERHQQQVERVERGLAELSEALRGLAEAGPDGEAPRLAETLRTVREALGAEQHNPLDPQRLPFRLQEARPERLSAEDAARAAASAAEAAAGEAAAPGPADLAATPDVQLSPGSCRPSAASRGARGAG